MVCVGLPGTHSVVSAKDLTPSASASCPFREMQHSGCLRTISDATLRTFTKTALNDPLALFSAGGVCFSESFSGMIFFSVFFREKKPPVPAGMRNGVFLKERRNRDKSPSCLLQREADCPENGSAAHRVTGNSRNKNGRVSIRARNRDGVRGYFSAFALRSSSRISPSSFS